MSKKKEQNTMGLPRAGKKRQWSECVEEQKVSNKILCTSPPHGLCAEDILSNPPPQIMEAKGQCPEESKTENASQIASGSKGDTISCCLTNASECLNMVLRGHDQTEVEMSVDDTSSSTKDSGFCRNDSSEPNTAESGGSSLYIPKECGVRLKGRSSRRKRRYKPFSTIEDGVTLCSPPSSPIQSPTREESSYQLELRSPTRDYSSEECEDKASNPSDADDSFMDDEEDKDSGFIDGNSIDNSSDDETESKIEPESAVGDRLFALCSETEVNRPPSDGELLLATSRVSDLSSTDPFFLPVLEPTNVQSVSFDMYSSASGSIGSAMSDNSTKSVDFKNNDGCITTVTAAQTGTIMTSAYQGSVTSSTFDLHFYHPSDICQSRPATSSWSCTFYDGTQPTTNKYMEIAPSPMSPSSSRTSQSIQCDANGKSYLELGSAAPYTTTFTNECGSFTTSPSSTSTYNGTAYTQSFSSGVHTPYGQSSPYFNQRQQPYCPSGYAYPGTEAYHPSYDESAPYTYNNGVYPVSSDGRSPINRHIPRCSSPICDLTKTSPRPTCYPQQRLSVLNLSMCKLNRFSRFPEPSLHRSVLICNTLRLIEKEMETEGISMASVLAQSHTYNPNHLPMMCGGQGPVGSPHCPETMPLSPMNEGPLPSMHSPLAGPPHHISTPIPLMPNNSLHIYPNSPSPLLPYPPSPYPISPDHMPFETREPVHLPPFSPSSPCPSSSSNGELLPEVVESEPPPPPSPTPSEEPCGPINWCSVLSLSSQTDMDSMNNNECHEWNNEEHSPLPSMSFTHQEEHKATPIQYQQQEEEKKYSPLQVQRRSSKDLLKYRQLDPSSPPSTQAVSVPSSLESLSGETEGTPTWKLPSLSADDVLRSFPEPNRRPEPTEELDSLIKVLVGS